VIGREAEARRSENGCPTAQQVAAWVARSCEAQGIAVKVTDSLVLAQVVALLEVAGARPPAGKRGRACTCPPSESPHRTDAVRVETLGAMGAGANGGVIQHRANDGYSSAEVEARPLLAQGVPATQSDECFGPGGA
jgi:hypothetical protein